MFTKEFNKMIGLLGKVLEELQKSNDLQKQIVKNQETEAELLRQLLLAQEAREEQQAPAEGNVYPGNSNAESGDCRSKCNGRCDNDEAGCGGTCG